VSRRLWIPNLAAELRRVATVSECHYFIRVERVGIVESIVKGVKKKVHSSRPRGSRIGGKDRLVCNIVMGEERKKLGWMKNRGVAGLPSRDRAGKGTGKGVKAHGPWDGMVCVG